LLSTFCQAVICESIYFIAYIPKELPYFKKAPFDFYLF